MSPIMPADVFCSQFDDLQQGMAEWEMYRDRAEWVNRQAVSPPIDDGGGG